MSTATPLDARGLDAARREIIRIGSSLFDRGYVHASAGNISASVDGMFLITPTDAPLGFLDAERIALVDSQGQQTAGDRASKTLALHRRIYEADRSARVVIHTHATHLVALTLGAVWRADDILPPITAYYVMKVGHVPLIPYHRPGDPAVADLVERAIKTRAADGVPIRAVMLERLGPVVWGPTPTAAMAVLEELEETAKLWLLTDRRTESLSPTALQELKDVFGASW